MPGPSLSLLSYSYTLLAHHWRCVSGLDVLPLHDYDGQILSGFPLFAILGLCMHAIDSSGSPAFKEMGPQLILPVWCQRCTAIYQTLIQHSLSSDKSIVHIVLPYCFHLSHVPTPADHLHVTQDRSNLGVADLTSECQVKRGQLPGFIIIACVHNRNINVVAMIVWK